MLRNSKQSVASKQRVTSSARDIKINRYIIIISVLYNTNLPNVQRKGANYNGDILAIIMFLKDCFLLSSIRQPWGIVSRKLTNERGQHDLIGIYTCLVSIIFIDA